MESKKLVYINVSRVLTLRGWEYYKCCGIYEIAISKSEYYKIKSNNKAFKESVKIEKDKLRNT